MRLSLKYFGSELAASTAKDTHSDTMFTNHMSCNIYNKKNEIVGLLTTRNHYIKLNDVYYVTATSTARLFGTGIMVFHIVYESPHELLNEPVRVIPHFKNGSLENKNIVAFMGPSSTGNMADERPMTFIIRRQNKSA